MPASSHPALSQGLSRRRARLRRGLSLVELLVAMAIGLVLAGGSATVYLQLSGLNRELNTRIRLHEDGQLALAIMARDLGQAGYAEPNAQVTGSGAFSPMAAVTRAVTGCARGLDTTRAAAQAGDLTVAECLSAGTTGAALEVVYAATVVNTWASADGRPTNCGGAELNVAAGASGITRNRYYVQRGSSGRNELYCDSPDAQARPGSSGQRSVTAVSIAENVDRLELDFGMASATDARTLVRMVKADQVNDWGAVRSVRICLEMASTLAVLPSDVPQTFRNCSGQMQTILDRIPRQSFSMTVALRNRHQPLS